MGHSAGAHLGALALLQNWAIQNHGAFQYMFCFDQLTHNLFTFFF